MLVAAAVSLSQRSCSHCRWSASSTMAQLPNDSFQRLFSSLVRALSGVVVVSAYRLCAAYSVAASVAGSARMRLLWWWAVSASAVSVAALWAPGCSCSGWTV